ncbi:hypothetical protein tb265_15800 [Gemmatimonadetes bacterium T265]|nr:hypothetical protein tb265_15800 [Gemmatimonadetes bacterium T265]
MSTITQQRPNNYTPVPETPAFPAGEPSSTESVQLRELVALLTRRRWLIVIVTAAVTAASAYWALSAPHVYRATAAIRLTNSREALAGRLANDDRQASATTYGDPIKTQIQVLTSRTVAAAVVSQVPVLLLRPLGFSPAVLDSVTVSPRAAAETLAVRFGPAGVTVRGHRGTRQAAYGVPVDYPDVRFVVTGSPGTDAEKHGGAVYVAPREQVITQIVGGLRATPRPESDVIDVEYTADDPYTAQRAVNAAIEAFRTASTESAVQDSRRRREFVEGQLRQNEATLASAEGALASFRSSAQTFGTKDKYTAEQHGLMEAGDQRNALAADRSVSQDLLARLEHASRGAAVDAGVRALVSAPGIAGDPVVTPLYTQLAQYQTMRDSLTTGPWASAATHPDVVRLDSLIAGTRASLVSAVRSHVSSLTAKISVLDSNRARSAAALSQLPQTEAEEVRLSTQTDALRKMGDQLREEYQRAKIAEAVDVGQVEVVDLAVLPTRPVGSGPLPKLFVGLLVGLVLGVGGAYAREGLDTSIYRREDVERLLHAPLLTVVPSADMTAAVAAVRRNRARDSRPDQGPADPRAAARAFAKAARRRTRRARKYALVATTATSGSPEAEAYVTLRTNLRFSRPSEQLRRLVITSPAPRDGKTTIAANIAACFAAHGQRVLLVDCDLRRPSLHYAFDVRPEVGLGDVLLGHASIDAAVLPAAGVPNLSLLLSAHVLSSPSQLLSSPQMGELLQALSDRYDLVILDTPPVLAVADAAILGTNADGVLLVVRAGTTARDEAQAAAGQLATVGARLLGVALNDPDNVVPQYSPYYYNYYTYYSTTSPAAA